MEQKTLELNDLLDSKIYVRNNISYMPPREIINPFLEKVGYSGEEINIQFQNEVINQNISGEENVAFPRFLVEVKKQMLMFGDVQYQNTYGLLVAMDQQNPVAKVYSGTEVSACTNLCIFNAEHTFTQNLMESLDNTWNAVKGFVSGEEAKIEEYRDTHLRLVANTLTQEDLNQKLGQLLRVSGSSKLGTTPIVKAAKLVSDRTSTYYAEKESNLYNLYNAITQSITDSKDLLYRPDKTMALTQMLLN